MKVQNLAKEDSAHGSMCMICGGGRMDGKGGEGWESIKIELQNAITHCQALICLLLASCSLVMPIIQRASSSPCRLPARPEPHITYSVSISTDSRIVDPCVRLYLTGSRST